MEFEAFNGYCYFNAQMSEDNHGQYQVICQVINTRAQAPNGCFANWTNLLGLAIETTSLYLDHSKLLGLKS